MGQDDRLREFRIWLVMYDVDMLMSQHQIAWDEITEGVSRLRELRTRSPLGPIPQPVFDARLIKGHTPVCKMPHEQDEPVVFDFEGPHEDN